MSMKKQHVFPVLAIASAVVVVLAVLISRPKGEAGI
jgi:preprotein translocase subunit SecG